tara:strand:- start:16216 stop:16419 length:204 start_codon:yes stop_codon:yes gene_type:complete
LGTSEENEDNHDDVTTSIGVEVARDSEFRVVVVVPSLDKMILYSQTLRDFVDILAERKMTTMVIMMM